MASTEEDEASIMASTEEEDEDDMSSIMAAMLEAVSASTSISVTEPVEPWQAAKSADVARTAKRETFFMGIRGKRRESGWYGRLCCLAMQEFFTTRFLRPYSETRRTEFHRESKHDYKICTLFVLISLPRPEQEKACIPLPIHCTVRPQAKRKGFHSIVVRPMSR